MYHLYYGQIVVVISLGQHEMNILKMDNRGLRTYIQSMLIPIQRIFWTYFRFNFHQLHVHSYIRTTHTLYRTNSPPNDHGTLWCGKKYWMMYVIITSVSACRVWGELGHHRLYHHLPGLCECNCLLYHSPPPIAKHIRF